MTLEELGFNDTIAKYRNDQELNSFKIGRIILEHKERYTVKTAEKEYTAEMLGNLRFSAESRADFPAVGDWVAFAEYDDDKAIIHAILTRSTVLERKAVGKSGQSQIIAVNIDIGIIVQSVNRDFSINRIERYITICNSSNITPLIVLSKTDLIDEIELEELLIQVHERITSIPIVALSNQSKEGIDELKAMLSKGLTYCLLGSSGVGKSTLINTLAEVELMDTGPISQRIDRGKHVTTHRELIVLEKGIIIDNPGMREVGITDISQGLEMTFDEILSLAHDCKFNDCTHTDEIDCAILGALEQEELNKESYENFLKMEKERAHYESDSQTRKNKGKDLGKMIKKMKKNHYKY